MYDAQVNHVNCVNQHTHCVKKINQKLQRISWNSVLFVIPGRIKNRAAHSENFLGGLVWTGNLEFRLQ